MLIWRKAIMKAVYSLSFLLSTFVLLSACDLHLLSHPESPQAWIDAPLDGSILPLAPYLVVYHGGSGDGVGGMEFSVNGEVLSVERGLAGASILVTRRYTWSPATPGIYTLQVRARGPSEWSAYAVSVVTILGDVETPTSTPAEETSTPMRATETSTPTCDYLATFTKNARCRMGPGMMYDTVYFFLEGQTAKVEAQSENGLWGWFSIPDSDAHCWSSSTVFTVSCDIRELIIVTAQPFIPPSTSTSEPEYSEPINCGQYAIEETCTAQPECRWESSGMTGYCTGK